MDGRPLHEIPVSARWAETVQPPDRTPFATLDDPELHEISLEPNGRPHVLDVVLRFASDPPGYPGGSCYVWNNESATTGVRQDRFRIEAPEFRVRVAIQGNNVPKLERVLHVEALTVPQVEWEGG